MYQNLTLENQHEKKDLKSFLEPVLDLPFFQNRKASEKTLI